MQAALPPPPEMPALPRGATPPAAVVGVLGVPEVMRASSAAQQVEKTIGERRQKLNEDAQKEQAAWRDLQQALGGPDRAKQSPEQVRAKERELQDRITSAQREFRERGNIIQEAAQYGLAQIERTLVGVIQRVAESRGMNLVLHRQQVALNVNEFDITEQVAEQLNKVLPTVIIPPDGRRRRRRWRRSRQAGQPRAGRPPRSPPPRCAARRRRRSSGRGSRADRGRSALLRSAPGRTRWPRWRRPPAAAAPRRRADADRRRAAAERRAGPGQLPRQPQLPAALEATGAGAVIVHPDMAARVPAGSVALVTAEPYVGWARVAALFHPLPPAAARHPPERRRRPGRRSIDPTAEIGPFAVIGARRRDRAALPHRRGRGDRRGRGARRRLPHRRACQRQPRPARRPRLRLSRRADRPGGVRLRDHRRAASSPCRSSAG